ncbi:MAG: glycosyltransferase family 2 protein, partial [Lentisphaeria bacterium]|nr:glycosyltransferase family 2 protein [Lentisphaeria bacterium]
MCDMVQQLFSQTLSAERFQIIIVDAASTDDTKRIAGELAEKYPRNIRVVHGKEACLNNARNEGIALAEGEYTCFWDTTFTPGRNLLAEVSNFLQDNTGLDVVCVPHNNGPNKMQDHWIFQKGSRVINLFKEPRLPLENIRIAFFKTEIARKVCFDVRLNHYSF